VNGHPFLNSVRTPLHGVISRKIHQQGPLTVAEYVDLALYHEEHGYYASAARRSGRAGDFFTSVDLGPVFGELLATQFAEMRELLLPFARDASPDTPRFDLCEAAAGSGRLARDVLEQLSSRYPAVYASTRLHLVETSAAARAAQEATLGRHAGSLATSWPELPGGLSGVIFANELLDALPPHAVVMREDGLREIYVDVAGGRLVTREGALSTPRLAEYLERVGARLEAGARAEVNLAAADWVRDAARSLDRGFLVLVDYGHEARHLYGPGHATGTLTTYRRHVTEAPGDGPGWLEEPGLRDITSHVDLTGVTLAAEAAGFSTLGVLDQGYFLLALSLDARFEAARAEPAEATRRRLALKTLLLPGGLGSTMKVLVFAKQVGRPSLKGLALGTRLT